MFIQGIDTKDNKTELMSLFSYNVIDDVVETPCGDIVDCQTIWSWLIRNGVSIGCSYQNNMTTYLERFGFTRTSYAHKKNAVLDILEREVTQKRALFAADLIRSRGLDIPCVMILSGKYVYVAKTFLPLEQSAKMCVAR